MCMLNKSNKLLWEQTLVWSLLTLAKAKRDFITPSQKNSIYQSPGACTTFVSVAIPYLYVQTEQWIAFPVCSVPFSLSGVNMRNTEFFKKIDLITFSFSSVDWTSTLTILSSSTYQIVRCDQQITPFAQSYKYHTPVLIWPLLLIVGSYGECNLRPQSSYEWFELILSKLYSVQQSSQYDTRVQQYPNYHPENRINKNTFTMVYWYNI